MYAIRGHPVTIEFWVYGYPDPDIKWYFKDEEVSRSKLFASFFLN